MKKVFLFVFPIFLFACKKETPSTNSIGGTFINPPPPPPSMYYSFPDWPYVYYQMPNVWTRVSDRGGAPYNSIDLREIIYDSNSATAANIDSIYIKDTSGHIYNILDTANSSGFYLEEALEYWLPGWEYKWFIRIIWKGSINSNFGPYPPQGRLIVRFRF